METFTVRAVVNDVLTVWKTRYQYLYILFVPILVVGLAHALLISPDAETSGLFFVLGILLEILYFYILMATVAIVLHLLRTNQEYPVEQVAKYTHIFLHYLLVNIVYGLIIVGGLILFIIPGIYFMVRYAWVTIYTIEHPDKSVEEIFENVARMTEGHRMKILKLFIVLLVPVVVLSVVVDGLVANQVAHYQNFVLQVVNYGLIFPWTILVSTIAYLKLYGGNPTPTIAAQTEEKTLSEEVIELPADAPTA